jgi:hypothetical protein
MRKVLVPTALFLSACADGREPTSPLPYEAPSTISAATAGARMDAEGAVDDALSRILPGFDEGGQTTYTAALSDALHALSATLAAGDAPRQESIESAEHALEALIEKSAGDRGALAELEAIRRVLDRATALTKPVIELPR